MTTINKTDIFYSHTVFPKMWHECLQMARIQKKPYIEFNGMIFSSHKDQSPEKRNMICFAEDVEKQNNKNYTIKTNSAGQKELVMVGNITHGEDRSGYAYGDIDGGHKGDDFTGVLYENIPQGTKVKIVVTVME